MSSLRFLNIDFFASFEEYHQIINHDGKEIAFVGASNSGKSSAINASKACTAACKSAVGKPAAAASANFFFLTVNLTFAFLTFFAFLAAAELPPPPPQASRLSF